MPTETIDIQQAIPDKFISIVEGFLDTNPTGFKEYDLIQALNQEDIFQRYANKDSSSLQMFQKHFLLFHVLYTLNEKMISENTGSIKISALLIQKYSYVEAQKEMGTHDPLREYYLDFDNMKDATEKTVDELLNSFWVDYLKNDKRKDALAVLNLCDPIDDKEIKSTYRQLVSQHHPDKGGDSEQIKQINTAYAILIKS